MSDMMDRAAVELDKWLRFASCDHLGYIGTGVGDGALFIYWDMRGVPGGMPETFCGFPLKLKRIARPEPAV